MKKAEQIGARIQHLREKRRMSLTDLAQSSGVSRGYIHLIEKGENNPTYEKLSSISKALGVTVAELTGEIETNMDLLNIPDSLREFADDNNLPSDDILMLSKINFEGQYPKTVDEWKRAYMDLLNIPDTLREFADTNNLPFDDILMLSKINFRGQKPSTAQEWKILYSVIKSTLDKD